MQLPHFFIAQGPIISGYTLAMSLDGPLWPPALYVIAVVILSVTFYRNVVRYTKLYGWIALLGMDLTLFIAFKAGFVRQDAHVFTATGVLLLISYIVSFHFCTRSLILVWAVVAATWLVIGNSIFPMNGAFLARVVTKKWHRMTSGIEERLADSKALDVKFNKANEILRREVSLEKSRGTVDLYPCDLSAIFANGLRWSGRPILQSYSDYDPILDAENVAHLRSTKAPETVFFTLAPIDNRLPAFDDSGSMLELLAHYNVAGYKSPYIRMEKHTGSAMASLIESESREVKGEIGKQIDITRMDPMWVSLDVRPTLLGRIIAILFKLPKLEIVLTLSDARNVTHRFIPAIGHTGFIISPYLANPDDIISLAAGLVGAPHVTSFKIITGSRVLWNNHFDVRLIPININPQASARSIILTQRVAPHSVNTESLPISAGRVSP
jgi:hypothetical protein